MSRKVYTYSSIDSIRNHPGYDEILMYPQIAASPAILAAMRKTYPQVNIANVFDVQKMISFSWDDSETIFQQYVSLQEVIRKLDCNGDPPPILAAFKKNTRSILQSIRQLVESDAYPDQLIPSSSEEKLFITIWERLEELDPSFGQFRAEMLQLENNQEAFYRYMTQKVEALTSGSVSDIRNAKMINQLLTADVIVMHGFYFITPMQDRIITMFENCGKDLIFLCHYSSSAKEVCKIWTKTLYEEACFPPISEWVADHESDTPNTVFGKLYEGIIGNTEAHDKRIKIIEYKTEMEFVRDFDRIRKEKRKLYSMDARLASDMLKEFYPELFQRRHLLAYPVGQYIYKLHSMWDPDSNEIRLSVDDIIECFATGWVESDGVNGKRYISVLENLRTYTKDCSTVTEWETRLNQLLDAEENAVRAFSKQLDSEPEENIRWHNILGNPFLNFSCFAVDQKDVVALVKLINHLLETARSLFPPDGSVNIASHLSKLQVLLKSRDAFTSDESALLREERIIIDELSKRLSLPGLKIRNCFNSDISSAIMLIIGGGILDEEEETISSENDEAIVAPFSMAEAAPFIAPEGKTHLCFTNEYRLPGIEREWPWPLTSDMMERLIASSDGKRAVYLKDRQSYYTETVLTNRYLFYSMMQSKDIEISWISTSDGKRVGPSPYTQILEQIYSVKSLPFELHSIETNDVEKAEPHLLPTISIKDVTKLPIKEMQYDVIACRKRYLYSYLVNDHQTFFSEFHYTHCQSKLISALAKESGTTISEIADEVFKLFPFMREVEKRQTFDYVRRLKASDYDDEKTAMDTASYPGSRLLIHFADAGLLERIQEIYTNLLNEYNGRFGTRDISPARAECMYCPYCNDCPDAGKGAIE